MVKSSNVAFAMWLGVMLDGIPEALMMACKSSAGTLEPEFILAVPPPALMAIDCAWEGRAAV